jgi:hypothetical protein
VQLVQMLAGGDVIAQVHEGNRIVEMFFDRPELRRCGAFQMLVAGIEMNAGAVGQFLAWPGYDLLKMRFRLIELMLLHRAQADLITLERLGVARVLGHGLLRCGFLSHVQNSSCALGNRGLLAVSCSIRAVKYHSKGGWRATSAPSIPKNAFVTTDNW